jgi:hypothetical protein
VSVVRRGEVQRGGYRGACVIVCILRTHKTKKIRGNSENRLGSDLDNVKKPGRQGSAEHGSCIDTATAPATFAGGLRTPACKDWAEDHVTLAALGTSKFIKAPQAQRLFYALQTALVDTPYRAHGKTDQSWDDTVETLYCPMMFRLLFGNADEEIQPHAIQINIEVNLIRINLIY